MSNQMELKRQANIIRSAKKIGGWGIKLSNMHSAGVVDLLLVIPTFAPAMVEVKDLGERKKTPLGAPIKTTPLQREFMHRTNDVTNSVFSFVMTTYHIGRDHFVFATLPGEQVITTLEDRFKVPTQQEYPLVDIFAHMGVPRSLMANGYFTGA